MSRKTDGSQLGGLMNFSLHEIAYARLTIVTKYEHADYVGRVPHDHYFFSIQR
jgi:hypothetical protein